MYRHIYNGEKIRGYKYQKKLFEIPYFKGEFTTQSYFFLLSETPSLSPVYHKSIFIKKKLYIFNQQIGGGNESCLGTRGHVVSEAKPAKKGLGVTLDNELKLGDGTIYLKLIKKIVISVIPMTVVTNFITC